MTRLACALAVVLGLATTPAAGAQLTSERLAAAYATAAPMQPVTCDVWIVRTQLPPHINAHASRKLCAIQVNAATWTSWDWKKLCTIVAHELGHIAGLDHVDDPASLMYPLYVAPASGCLLEPPVRGEPRLAAVPRPVTARQWVRFRQREIDHARQRAWFWTRLDAPEMVSRWRADARRALRGKRHWQRRATART